MHSKDPARGTEKESDRVRLPPAKASPWAEKAGEFLILWVDKNHDISPALKAAFTLRVQTEDGCWNQHESIQGVYGDPKDPGVLCIDYLHEGENLQIRMKLLP